MTPFISVDVKCFRDNNSELAVKMFQKPTDLLETIEEKLKKVFELDGILLYKGKGVDPSKTF